MKKLIHLLAASATIVTSAMAQGHKPDGIWLGTLEVGVFKIRVVLHVDKSPSGGYTSTIDSPDQGITGIKTDAFISTDEALTFSAFGGKFDGKYSTNGEQIVGTFAQNGRTLPLTLVHRDKAPIYSRTQDPKPPFPYDSEDVVYTNTAQKITLAGTITKPKGAGPFPAVVLITGSGAENRNEEILGHRPFWVLADYLTRRGIEVLRVDDRGVGGSSGSTQNSTSSDFVTDVLAGVDFLKHRSEVDKKHIGLIGHSEGGIIAPMVASQSSDVNFIVMMAGTGMTGYELLPLQLEAVERAQGLSKDEVHRHVQSEIKGLNFIRTEQSQERVKEAFSKIYDDDYAHMTPSERKAAPNKELALSQALAQMNTPWFRYFLSLDPRTYLERVKCSVLALNGSLDTQVPADVNLPEIEKALKKGGNTHYTLKKLPRLNHLFQTAKTGSPSEYTTIEETLSPLLLQTVGDWILQNVK